MKEKELWGKLDAAIDGRNLMMVTMEMAALLKQTYIDKLGLLCQIFYSREMPGMEFQAYLGDENERFWFCCTNKE